MTKQMNSVETMFMYHNVGQGLFYSGEIRALGTIFRFVYDCGSKNIQALTTAIRRFKQDAYGDKINLLIISHLHSDHVNGLEELFNNFEIMEVILPYFSPIERLLIAFRKINMPSWYYEFLADPVRYLLERGVRKVIILGGDEGYEEDVPEEVGPFPPEEKFDVGELKDDEKLKKSILQYDRDWEKYIGEKLIIKNHIGYAVALGFWLFRFFNYKISLPTINELKNCLEKSGLVTEDTKSIKKAIRVKKERKKLKECYELLKKDLRKFNNTSLILYHGPIGKHKENILLYPYIFPHLYFYQIKEFLFTVNNFGQFLTGDADLNFKYDTLKRHYKKYFKSILITQVPHHGAKQNWNKEIMKDAQNSKFWVISVGLNNFYGHPSYSVIEDIVYSNRRECFVVNENVCMLIKGKVF